MPPKRKLYKVRPKRCVVLRAEQGRGSVNWAKEGDIIDLSHPMLASDLEGQMHMLKPHDKLKKGETVKDDYPLFYQKKIKRFESDALSNTVSVQQIQIDTQVEELQRTVEELQAENKALKARIEELTMETSK